MLLAHPAVREAVAFAMPDEKYGEPVGAASCSAARPGRGALAAHCAERLAAFKVPARIVVARRDPEGADRQGPAPAAGRADRRDEDRGRRSGRDRRVRRCGAGPRRRRRAPRRARRASRGDAPRAASACSARAATSRRSRPRRPIPARSGQVDVVVPRAEGPRLRAQPGRCSTPLLRPRAPAVVAAQNGIPWWYFHGLAGPYRRAARSRPSTPAAPSAAVIAPERAIGCVVYGSTEIEAPGVIRHIEGTRFSIGEPDGSISERCRSFSEAMVAGGLKCPVEPGHPRRPLGQADGQRRVQPHQRADARDDGRDLPSCTHARPRRRDDGGDARGRSPPRLRAGGRDRAAPRRRRARRRAQDLDAAGPRGRQAARARRPSSAPSSSSPTSPASRRRTLRTVDALSGLLSSTVVNS